MWVGRSQWGEGDAYLNADLAGLLVVDHLLAPAAADAVVASMMHGKKVCVTLCRVAICSRMPRCDLLALRFAFRESPCRPF